MYSKEKINLTTPIERFRYSVTSKTFDDLERSKIATLGDLVSMSISDIVNNKMNSRYGKLEIVEFVHSLGYKFKDETVYIVTEDGKTTLVSLKTQLSDLKLLLSTKLYNCFMGAGMITLGDLVSKSESDLLKIEGIGQTSLRETIRFLHLFGYKLGDDIKQKKENIVVEETSIEIQIRKCAQENLEISKRIDSKQHLLTRYEELMNQRQALLEREKKLDYKIAQIMQGLTESVGAKDEQKVK